MPTRKNAHREIFPQGKMPTGKNAHREIFPQGKMPTGKNAHREKCPQGKNAHMYNSFKIVTGMSVFVKNRAMRKGILRSQKSWKKIWTMTEETKKYEKTNNETKKQRNL